MPEHTSKATTTARIERELERERHQRELNQETRAGMHTTDTERLKDPRESNDITRLRR